MRFVYNEPTVSVPAPEDLAPPSSVPLDTLHDLLHRRAEAQKNKLLFHLTESDCNLICTNAQEIKFTSGQVIAAEGSRIHSVYRLKSGKITLLKGGTKLMDLPKGYFIGESLFIRGNAEDVFGVTLIANGPVVLGEVNLPFLRQLLNMDKVLAFKIYRHIASKFSTLLFNIVGKLSAEPLPIVRIRSDSINSTNSNNSNDGSNDSSSVASSGTELDLELSPKTFVSAAEDILTRKKKKSTCRSPTKDMAFKTYALFESCAGGHVMLYTRKLVVTTGCKLGTKKSIKYNKILDMAKTGTNSVTIIYGVQARTLFFKDEKEMEEFFSLVQSLIISGAGNGITQLPSSPKPATPPLPAKSTNPLALSTTDPEQIALDRQEIMKLAVRQDVKRGDIIVSEGDLYQRIYTVANGELQMRSGDRKFVTIREGEVFGVITLFHLRPCNVTIEVVSDTATLLIIPNYKIHELVTSNFALAVRLHKKAAQLLYSQLERLLLNREGPANTYSETGIFV